jgi:hypothetical protein
MDFLKLNLGNDTFNLVLEYYDPIKTRQIEEKKKIYKLFKSVEDFYYLRLSDQWLIPLKKKDNIKRKIRRKNIGVSQSLFKEIYGFYNTPTKLEMCC